MTNAIELKEILTNLDWEHYVAIADEISVINKSRVEEELVKGPRIYAMYAGLFNLAKAEVANAEKELETYYHTTRKSLISGSDKKIADNKLDSMVKSTVEYEQRQTKVNSWSAKENLLKGLMIALDKRHENLIQLSSNHRAEMKLNS